MSRRTTATGFSSTNTSTRSATRALGRRRVQVPRRRESELHQAARRTARRETCGSTRATFTSAKKMRTRQRLRDRPQAAEQDSRDAATRARHELRSGRTGRRRLAAAMALVAGAVRSAWKVEKPTAGERAAAIQRRSARATDSWLRYENLVPTTKSGRTRRAARQAEISNEPVSFPTPTRPRGGELVTDANPYDARGHAWPWTCTMHELGVDPEKLGCIGSAT